jgi:aspartyl-tRNA(Asn)/glutamyl-tRNA(Gln) amidotransferase subunit A
MHSDLTHWSACELVAGYAAKKLSPIEVMEAVLEQVGRVEGVFNAFREVQAEESLQAAARSTVRWQRGDPLGPMDGVPVSVKDTLRMRGLATRLGSLTTDARNFIDEDSPSVAALRAAGALLFAKTNVPEFAFKIVTESSLTGATRNAWAPRRSSGGSSGGAAVAVALGCGPLALGTDAGGSVRLPSAWNGVFGFKPSYELLPDADEHDFAGLCSIGPLSRTVADAALILDACTRRCDAGLDWGSEASAEGRRQAAAGLRIAFSADLGLADVELGIADSVAAAARGLRRLGARVEEIAPPPPLRAFLSSKMHSIFVLVAARRRVDAVSEELRDKLDPDLARLAEMGRGITTARLAAAMQERRALTDEMEHFFREHDVLVSPTFHCGPPPVPGLPSHLRVPPAMTSWCNHTGQPAASIPCGFGPDGMPVGMQVVAARGRDDLVLQTCAAYEAQRGLLPWPTGVQSLD